MPKLILTTGAETYTLEVGKIFRIGRHPDNDLPLRESQVSRWHSEVRQEEDHYKLMDLDSLNGTYVNDQRLKSTKLSHGDVIQIGSHKLLWQDESAPQEDSDVNPFGEDDIVKSVDDLRFDEPPEVLKPGEDAPPYARAPEHLYLLLQIAELLNSEPTLDIFLETTLSLVLESLDADRGAILVKEGDVLVTKMQKARKGDFRGEVPISRTITKKVMAEGLRVLTADAQSDPRFDQGASISAYDIRSAICVPLWEAGKARGVLYMDNVAVDRAFSEEDLDLAGAIAHHLALGIRHHELIDLAKREAVMRHHLERYHSPDVVDLLLRQSKDAQKMELAPKEQEVTILFCDIVDFCSLAAKLSPQDAADLLSMFYDEMTTVVFRHAGNVNKFIGDAVMALWGAPFSHGDDPERAVKCAADMFRGLYKMLKKMAPEKWFRLRIGINTGRVIAGHVGSENILEYTVVGMPVNIASRIQVMAQPNQMLIGETTREQLGPGFPTVDLGHVDVKGADGPIRVFEVVWSEISYMG